MNILIITISFIPPKSIKGDIRACFGAKCGYKILLSLVGKKLRGLGGVDRYHSDAHKIIFVLFYSLLLFAHHLLSYTTSLNYLI